MHQEQLDKEKNSHGVQTTREKQSQALALTCLRDGIVYEDKDGLLRVELDPLTDHVNELACDYIRGSIFASDTRVNATGAGRTGREGSGVYNTDAEVV